MLPDKRIPICERICYKGPEHINIVYEFIMKPLYQLMSCNHKF